MTLKHRRNAAYPFAMLFGFALLTGCGHSNPTQSNDAPLEGTEWTLVAINDVDNFEPAEMRIDDGMLGGQLACNNIRGSITTGEDGKLQFGPIGATMKLCDDAKMAEEAEVLAILSGTAQYTISERKLVLSGDNGTLTFDAK